MCLCIMHVSLNDTPACGFFFCILFFISFFVFCFCMCPSFFLILSLSLSLSQITHSRTRTLSYTGHGTLPHTHVHSHTQVTVHLLTQALSRAVRENVTMVVAGKFSYFRHRYCASGARRADLSCMFQVSICTNVAIVVYIPILY